MQSTHGVDVPTSDSVGNISMANLSAEQLMLLFKVPARYFHANITAIF